MFSVTFFVQEMLFEEILFLLFLIDEKLIVHKMMESVSRVRKQA